jgi:hypothetical protein
MTESNSIIDIESPEFFEFINREFEKTAIHATIEDLAEFAFGSIEDAVNEFKKYRTE